MPYFIGFDVGTQSVRACLVDTKGKVLRTFVQPIQIFHPQQDFYEQSSQEIWEACCTCSREVVKDFDISQIIGTGFTATCSLVVLDEQFLPLTASLSGKSNQNVIMWMDHRAFKETEMINKTNHSVLKYVGGLMSLEMQPPKLLWIKKNIPNTWKSAGYFMDLPDFLTWKATGSSARSLCSVTCKWMYQSKDMEEHSGWDDTFWKEIGLNDLLENNYRKIGNEIKMPGNKCGDGLSEEAAHELGLQPRTPVGMSLIDAYAGGLGMFLCTTFERYESLHSKLGVICGTSSCHLTLSKDPIFTPGVWGPYFSVLLPGFWTNEGGQSATGKLIDHIVYNHPAYPELKLKVGSERVFNELDNIILQQQEKFNLPFGALLTNSFHIFPDYHGNRSPLADPVLKGMICGLTLNNDETDLAKQYLAVIQALAYETRYIIAALEKAGHFFSSLIICGGLSKNYTFIQTLADVTGLTVIKPTESEVVLLGAAILGAMASGYFKDTDNILKCMGHEGTIYVPTASNKHFHQKKYEVFLKMLSHQEEYKSIMNS